MPLLQALEARRSAQEAAAAQADLSRLKVSKMDGAILKALPVASPAVRVQVIDVLRERGASAAAPEKTIAAPGRGALLRILGSLGGARPLAAVEAALRSDDRQIRDAALRILAAWPDAGPVATLLDVAAASSTSQVDRALTALAEKGELQAMLARAGVRAGH